MSTTVKESKKSENKKSELLLDSLEIKGYRCFEHLTIEKLGRVNLIVGKNNVGKTALLEALWIFFNVGKILQPSKYLLPNIFEDILKRRNENKLPQYFSGDSSASLKSLFNWKNTNYDVLIGKYSKTDAEPYKFNFNLISRQEANGERFKLINGKETKNLEYNLKRIFIESIGLESQDIANLWDEVELKEEERDVNESLKFILPNLIQVRLRNVQSGSNFERIPFVQVNNLKEPHPLKTFGEGLNRLFGISLALANCKDGVLLIDEIEGGFHYSVLPDVWKLIFKTAKDLNVQVFATTHSFDCIEAFTQAAIDDKESDGMLIRLENKNGTIKAVTFSEDELETVTRRNIEVR